MWEVGTYLDTNADLVWRGTSGRRHQREFVIQRHLTKMVFHFAQWRAVVSACLHPLKLVVDDTVVSGGDPAAFLNEKDSSSLDEAHSSAYAVEVGLNESNMSPGAAAEW